MGYVKNTNDHYIYVDVGDGKMQRLAPGQIVEVEGDAETKLKKTSGVEDSSEQDYNEYLEERSGGSTEQTEEMKRNQQIGDLRSDAEHLAVSAPLQVVVGDDDAPFGPPSGTITTKQAIVGSGEDFADKRAFADHEQFEVPEGASEIEQRQAERKAAINKKAEELLTGKSEGDGVSQGEGSGQPQQEQQTRKTGRPTRQEPQQPQ